MAYPKDQILRPPDSSSDPNLGFDTWQTPNTERPTLIEVQVSLDPAAGTDAEAQLEVDESGGTTPDYTLARNATGGLAGPFYSTWLTKIPAGGSYQINNVQDPLGTNAIEVLREFTL